MLLSIASISNATVTTYTNRAAFLAAITGATNIDFNGLSGGLQTQYSSLNLSGVTFTTNGSMYVVNPAYYSGYNIDGTDVLGSFYAGLNDITATLPGGVSAVGTDFGGLFGSEEFGFLLSTGDFYSTTVPAATSGPSFVGFITDTGTFSSVDMFNRDGSYGIYDNFVYGVGSSSTVPEPGSLAMIIGVGVSGAGLLLRRRK